MSKPDLMSSKAQLVFPGWRPVLQALTVTTEDEVGAVEMSWSDDGELILEVLAASEADWLKGAVHAIHDVLLLTCDSCGRLGQPVRLAATWPLPARWAVRCETHSHQV